MAVEILWGCAIFVCGFIIGAVVHYFFGNSRETEEYEIDTEFLSQCYTNFINSFLFELLANYKLIDKSKIKTDPLGEGFYRVSVGLTGAEAIIEFDLNGGRIKVVYIVERANSENCDVYEKKFKYSNNTTDFIKVRKFGDKMFNIVANNQLAKHEITEDNDGNLNLTMADGSIVKVNGTTGEILNRDECDADFLKLYDEAKKVMLDNNEDEEDEK